MNWIWITIIVVIIVAVIWFLKKIAEAFKQ